MTRTQKTVTLTVLAAALIAVCVMTCRSFLAVPDYGAHDEKRQCHIGIANQQLHVDISGSGQIKEVHIERPNGTTVATDPGCGADLCNYSMARFPSGTYHIIVFSTTATYAGDIDWHSPLEPAH